MNKCLVGSYAAVVPSADDRGGSHADLVAALRELPSVAGLELPFAGSLPTSDPAFRDACRNDWGYVVTAFPDTMLRAATTPTFGLASPDDDGRRQAVAHARAIRDAVVGLHDDLGRDAVLAVELHSAPRQLGTRAAMQASLDEIALWDWDAASITIEHCDAWTAERPVQKGFLPIEDELGVLGRLSAPGIDLGLTVNWARSVIETHDVCTAVDHVSAARDAGLLRGLVFSGVADQTTGYGEPWLDAHLAPSTVTAASLLRPENVTDCLKAAGDDLLFLGLKIGLRPMGLTLAERVERIRQAVELLV